MLHINKQNSNLLSHNQNLNFLIFDKSGKIELTLLSSLFVSSFFTGSSRIKLHPRNEAAFLLLVFVRFPVKPVCIETLGAITANDESDLSFLFAGKGIGDKTSGALVFLLLRGNNFVLMSCKLWSALHIINRNP